MLDSTTSAVLGDVGITLAQDDQLSEGFIAHRIFPAFPVKTKKGDMPRLMHRRRVQTVLRNKDGSFNRVETPVDQKSYAVQETGLEEALSDTDRAHFEQAFDAELAVARGLVKDLLRARDSAAAATLFSTSTFGAGYNTAATGTWGGGSSNPIKDVELAKDAIRQKIGRFPNKMLIGAGLWTKASYDPAILAQVKTLRSYAGDITASNGRIALATLALVFGVDEVIVGMEVKDSAQEGTGSETLADLWDNTHCLVFYSTPTPEILGDITLGRMFAWDAVRAQGNAPDQSAPMIVDGQRSFWVDYYRENKRTADIIRCRDYIQLALLNLDAGYLITGC